jgi:hypothetical protein
MVQAWPITGSATWAGGWCVGLLTAWQGSSRVSCWMCPGMQRIAHTAVCGVAGPSPSDVWTRGLCIVVSCLQESPTALYSP